MKKIEADARLRSSLLGQGRAGSAAVEQDRSTCLTRRLQLLRPNDLLFWARKSGHEAPPIFRLANIRRIRGRRRLGRDGYKPNVLHAQLTQDKRGVGKMIRGIVHAIVVSVTMMLSAYASSTLRYGPALTYNFSSNEPPIQ